MGRKCQITGKKAMSGHLVSHSNIKVNRRFRPNLQTKRILNPATGTLMKVTLSTRALKTLSRWQAEGKMYDLNALIAAKKS